MVSWFFVRKGFKKVAFKKISQIEIKPLERLRMESIFFHRIYRDKRFPPVSHISAEVMM